MVNGGYYTSPGGAAPAVSNPGTVGGAVGAVLSIGNPIGAILTGLNQVASLVGLNSSDPVRDQERIDRINTAFQAAMAGDNRPITSLSAHTNLEGATGAQYLEYIATNNGGHPELPGPGTAAPNVGGEAVYGSQIAYRYAQAKFGEYKARLAVGAIGVDLIGQSTIPATVKRALTSPLVLIAIVAVVAFIIYKVRGK